MATIQASGIKTVCQHKNATCSMVAMDTATDETGAWEFSDFRCPDCGRSFPHILAQNGVYRSMRVLASEHLPSAQKKPQPAKPDASQPKTSMTPEERNAARVAKAREQIIANIGGDGPGTRLALGFFDKGYHAACQACENLARQMNQWGSAECRNRMDYIVNDILPRAEKWLEDTHKRANAFLDLVGNAVDVKTFALKNRIRALVVEAIDEWDASQSKGETE